jgi:hypothetical protein
VLKEDGKLFTKDNKAVIFNGEEAQVVIELVHKDLGHYGKEVTKDGVKKRYVVARDVWEKGEKVLDACVPCQLHKRPKNTTETATIHPYGVKDPFGLWEIDFVGPLTITYGGNLYLITAIDYATSKAHAYPLMARSADAAAELLHEIVWTYGRPAEIVTDNGAEFISDKFQAVRRRYGIHHIKTSPGHPQTNGKVERLNHELVERLKRIAAEPQNDIKDWDLYLRQALFAFSAHKNSRTGTTPFFLQYGVEPVLPSSAAATTTNPISRVEVAEATEHRRQHVQNLNKYRTDAAKRYQTSLEKLASSRDHTAFLRGPIIPGSLVMRSPINQKSKLHPKWDGPFIVLASSDKDTYQLASANGYVIRNLVNETRIRKLSLEECERYTGEFWEASKRLRSQDLNAKHQRELHDVDVQLRKATTDQLEAQRKGEPSSLQKIAELSKQKRQIVETQKAAEQTLVEDTPPQRDTTKRIRRLPWRLRQS